MGICSRTASGWSDDLIEEQLNLDPLEEQSTMVVALSRREMARKPEPAPLRPGPSASAKAAREFCELEVQQVFEKLYLESRIKEGDLHLGRFAIPTELLQAHSIGHPSVLLPPLAAAQSGRLAENILAERTSQRSFASKPVSIEQLGALLCCAQHGDSGDWPEEHDAGLPLIFLVLAWRVDGLSPGVYEYRAQDHALQFHAESSGTDKAAALFVQSEFASAPLVIWIAGNLAAACARHGAFGHRASALDFSSSDGFVRLPGSRRGPGCSPPATWTRRLSAGKPVRVGNRA